MIRSFYLKNNLSFEEAQLEFQKGLIVFTGPSGSGKSVLFDSFLGLFGLKEAKSEICEAQIEGQKIADERFGIEEFDEISIKQIKKDKIRFLINNQSISKNQLNEFCKSFVRHLHIKDTSEFDAVNLLSVTDEIATKKFANFGAILENFTAIFKEYSATQQSLAKLIEDEAKAEELKEFLTFEIKKIETIDPKTDEYEELSELKKQISKKEKIIKAIDATYPFFELSSKVTQALSMLEIDPSFFEDAMAEAGNVLEMQKSKFEDLSDSQIETILDRIEKLSSLNKRFGSIEGALEFLQTKKIELEKLENITFEKASLEKKSNELVVVLQKLAEEISRFRAQALELIQERTNTYLQELFLPACQFGLKTITLGKTGADKIEINFGDKNFDKLSSGEFNRLRLSYLSAIGDLTNDSDGGILFLDEIDANLSGKESFAISKVLSQLAQTYQVFAISHQPQLTASATQHFLVTKDDSKSYAKELNFDERVDEISRMISLDEVGEDAKNYAIKLLKECGKCQR